MAQPQFKGATEERRRYLVVLEIESDVEPQERPHDFMLDLVRNEDYTGTDEEWHEMLEGKGGGSRPDAEVVEVVAVKDMGAAD